MARQQYSDFLMHLYGCKVQKLNVNAGFSCPNRDGTLGTGGCIYCNNASFTPGFSKASHSVTQQLNEGKLFFANKYPEMHYLAYFQSFTGTYAPVWKLRELYNEALDVPEVIGLVVSTRPDCLGDDVVDLLQEINEKNRVIVEIGIETSHDCTLKLINRLHSWQCAEDAISRVASRGLKVGMHLILGLPSETMTDMMTTVDRIATLPVSCLKFHQLQVLRGTRLAQQWESGAVALQQWTAQEYAALCRQILQRLPERIVVERMVSTAPSELLLYPKWGLKPQEFKEIFRNI